MRSSITYKHILEKDAIKQPLNPFVLEIAFFEEEDRYNRNKYDRSTYIEFDYPAKGLTSSQIETYLEKGEVSMIESPTIDEINEIVKKIENAPYYHSKKRSNIISGSVAMVRLLRKGYTKEEAEKKIEELKSNSVSIIDSIEKLEDK
ncbi:hypothetical protein [Flammeovirga sp. SJP92]|uniref:hypothetical protein n=1 Tax=Flammeovirga sp. SJP92 TaxID=1775430 RepID=UPI0007879FEA|nr:hypothetical protein [Flammeovirga sp. SJP92]KXX67409.1 hypothetical protein AVL50_26940 [Flammeovirga sp. SJP92]